MAFDYVRRFLPPFLSSPINPAVPPLLHELDLTHTCGGAVPRADPDSSHPLLCGGLSLTAGAVLWPVAGLGPKCSLATQLNDSSMHLVHAAAVATVDIPVV